MSSTAPILTDALIDSVMREQRQQLRPPSGRGYSAWLLRAEQALETLTAPRLAHGLSGVSSRRTLSSVMLTKEASRFLALPRIWVVPRAALPNAAVVPNNARSGEEASPTL